MTIAKKINLSIAALVLLIVLIVAFILYPLFQGISNNSKELFSQKEKSAAIGAEIERLEEFRILYKGLQEILEKIDNLFIDPEVPVEFISFLETIAEEQQLKIEISSVLAARIEEEPWPSLVFQITAIGPFQHLLRFLEKIENSPYLVEIKNINIIKMEEGAVSASFSIKVFTKPH